ncbi:MAG: DNA polymerase III subunit gamma/tau [Syntrophaceae bacterium]|nr:DNA polymerase III subunit gamma/tau [Syntrophaceae bacterium]
MDYLVLARKWRPQRFEDVVGQEPVVRTLRNAIRHQRLAHALVFGGPRGVGKTTVARILAKAVNCEHGPTETPCNECVHCREIRDGVSLDVREIDGASNRGIDEVRELRENVKFAPVSCRYKIYIIDEVHMLTREAFNALLKTLEEPPEHTLFIFATTETSKIPATILSRCQCHDFHRAPISRIAENLRAIAEAEGVCLSDQALRWIAESADGSIRDGQSIFDQVIAYAGLSIEDSQVEELLGFTERKFLPQLSDAVFRRDAGACLRMLHDGYYAGMDMAKFFGALLDHFRSLLLVKVLGAETEVLELSPEEKSRLAEQVQDVGREELQRYADMLLAEEENVRKSGNPRLTLETILIRMAYLEPLLPIGQVLERLERMESRLSGGPGGGGGGNRPSGAREETAAGRMERKPPAMESAGRAAASETGTGAGTPNGSYSATMPADGDPSKLWEGLKQYIKNQSYPLWSKIQSGQVRAVEDQRIVIGFPTDYVFLEDLHLQKSRLQELAGTYFGGQMTVQLESVALETSANNGSRERAESEERNQKRQEALHSPMLQKVLDLFEGAEVREIISR